jgi:hypothetical protein
MKGQPDASAVVRDALLKLAQDDTAHHSARASALRTLAEIDGLVGRHQVMPERTMGEVHALSRSELMAELDRLRAVSAADKRRTKR